MSFPTPEIRETGPGDLEFLERLYPAVFPEEDLLPLVRDLLAAPDGVVSLVAIKRGGCVDQLMDHIVGHVALSLCGVNGNPDCAALLGPLAIDPDHQRQGLGTAMVRKGVSQMLGRGVQRVCLLGDPSYYSRLGFVTERDVLPPYPMPADWEGAWQSVDLGDKPKALGGTMDLPAHWRNPVYWQP